MMADTFESLFLLRHSPYQSGLCKEALDLLLAGAAFDCKQALVLLDDAVFAATQNHDTKRLGQKNLSKIMQVLPVYEVNALYYCQESAEQRGLSAEHLHGHFSPLNQKAINQLIDSSQHIYSF